MHFSPSDLGQQAETDPQKATVTSNDLNPGYCLRPHFAGVSAHAPPDASSRRRIDEMIATGRSTPSSGRSSPHRDAKDEQLALRQLLGAVAETCDLSQLLDVALNGIALDGSASRYLALALQRAPCLRSLRLRFCGAGAEGLAIVLNGAVGGGAALGLDRLDLAGNRLTAASLKYLVRLLEPLRNLRRLDLGNNLLGRKVPWKLFLALSRLPRLTHLRLSHCEIADAAYQQLVTGAAASASAKADLVLACEKAGARGLVVAAGMSLHSSQRGTLLLRVDPAVVRGAGGPNASRLHPMAQR